VFYGGILLVTSETISRQMCDLMKQMAEDTQLEQKLRKLEVQLARNRELIKHSEINARAIL
jgi:hypothetical protein